MCSCQELVRALNRLDGHGVEGAAEIAAVLDCSKPVQLGNVASALHDHNADNERWQAVMRAAPSTGSDAVKSRIVLKALCRDPDIPLPASEDDPVAAQTSGALDAAADVTAEGRLLSAFVKENRGFQAFVLLALVTVALFLLARLAEALSLRYYDRVPVAVTTLVVNPERWLRPWLYKFLGAAFVAWMLLAPYIALTWHVPKEQRRRIAVTVASVLCVAAAAAVVGWTAYTGSARHGGWAFALVLGVAIVAFPRA